MKGVAIVGDHNTGKTTLGKRILKYLRKKNYKVLVVKHMPHTKYFSDPTKDTEQYFESSDLVVAEKEDSYVIYHRDRLTPHKLFALARSLYIDFLLYEGTPRGIFVPWIKVGTGKGDSPYTMWCLENPSSLSEEEIITLVDDILDKAWEIPMMLNCGKCGVETCREYIERVLSREDISCVLWHSRLRIIVDGREIPLVPFIDGLYSSVMDALVKNLKGIDPDYSKVEIYMRREKHEN